MRSLLLLLIIYVLLTLGISCQDRDCKHTYVKVEESSDSIYREQVVSYYSLSSALGHYHFNHMLICIKCKRYVPKLDMSECGACEEFTQREVDSWRKAARIKKGDYTYFGDSGKIILKDTTISGWKVKINRRLVGGVER